MPASLKHCDCCAGAMDIGGSGPQYDVYGRPVTDPLQEAAADVAENARPLLVGRIAPQRSQEERDTANAQARAEQRAWWDAELEKARRETHGGPRPVNTWHPPQGPDMLCWETVCAPTQHCDCCCGSSLCAASTKNAVLTSADASDPPSPQRMRA